LIIGKFMPPHLGHQYLIDFAKNYVDKLNVLVCSIKSEPMPGSLRYRWVREMFPDVNVISFTYENPQEPHEHINFWQIWRDTIYKVLPQGADYLFASEKYGWKLADVLQMNYVPVDHARELVPVSGTAIRQDPQKNWSFIPSQVRPHFIKRVCIFGPESTGKSTLARDLAKHFNTLYVHEYARGLIDAQNGECSYADIEKIAKGQIAAEAAIARQANKVMFCDTDLITTTIWSKILFKKCPAWIEEEATRRKYDLYLLLDIDVPWVADKQRFLPEKRKWFLDLCIKELKRRNKPYVLISGNWQERFKKAVKEVERIVVRR